MISITKSAFLKVLIIVSLCLCPWIRPLAHAEIFPQALTVENFPAWLNKFLPHLEWDAHQINPKLNLEILQQSFSRGRQFMINNQRPAGNFNYQYDFVKRQMDKSDNQVRQAGALWGLALMYQHAPNEENKVALDRAVGFFSNHTLAGPVEKSLIIAYPGQSTCKTGTVALVAMGIIEYLRTARTAKIELTHAYWQKLRDMLKGYIEFLKFMRLETIISPNHTP